jgi:hypothetical protein
MEQKLSYSYGGLLCRYHGAKLPSWNLNMKQTVYKESKYVENSIIGGQF